jgi:hypothetical protein
MEAYRLFGVCLTAVPAALCLASCEPPTEEAIQEEFNQAVAMSNDCETDADCVLVTPGCPLGCGSAVNIEHETEIRNLAKKLIFEWQLGGRSCNYGCPYMTAVCTEGTCEAVESSEQAWAAHSL